MLRLFVFVSILLSTKPFFITQLPALTKRMVARPMGFDGLLKEQPEDFLVIEDGVLLNLDHDQQEAEKGDPIPIVREYTEQEKLEVVDWMQRIAGLTEMQIQLLQSIAQSDDAQQSAVLSISPPLSKITRTDFHQKLRILYGNILESKTEKPLPDGPDTTLMLIYRKGQTSIKRSSSELKENFAESKPQKQRVVKFWDKSLPEYYHFSTVKTYLSTTELIGELSRKTGLLPSRFSYAGTKDKRAVTAQRLSVWRGERAALERVSSLVVKNVRLRVFDIAPSKHKLYLGGLQGNLFCITVRQKLGHEDDEQAARDTIRTLDGSGLARRPFANLFGPQRFGAPLPTNPVVGKYLLRSDYKRAVLLLLLCPSGQLEVRTGLNVITLCKWVDRAAASTASLQHFCDVEWAEHVDRMLQESPPLGSGLDEKILDFGADDAELDAPEQSDPSVSDIEIESVEPDNATQRGSEHQGQLEIRLDFTTAVLRSQYTKLPGRLPLELRLLYTGVLDALEQQEAQGRQRDLLSIDFAQVFNKAYTKNLRLLFVNALQSDLWNQYALRRKELSLASTGSDRGAAAVGDVVLLDSETHTGVSHWTATALNVNLNAQGLLFDTTELQGAVSPSPRYCLHTVTRTEAEHSLYSADCVVIPLLGHAVPEHCLHPVGQAGTDTFAKLLLGTADDIPAASLKVPGAWRHYLASARNVGYMLTHSGSNDLPEVAPASTAEPTLITRQQDSRVPAASFTGKVDSLYASGRLQSMLKEMLSSRQQTACDSDKTRLQLPAETGDIVATDKAESCIDPGPLSQVRLVFTLPASSYATTYLEALGLIEGTALHF